MPEDDSEIQKAREAVDGLTVMHKKLHKMQAGLERAEDVRSKAERRFAHTAGEEEKQTGLIFNAASQKYKRAQKRRNKIITDALVTLDSLYGVLPAYQVEPLIQNALQSGPDPLVPIIAAVATAIERVNRWLSDLPPVAPVRRGYRREIRAWIKRKGLTNETAARYLGVSKSTLKSIMSQVGEKRYSDETLAEVLRKTGIEP